MCKILKRWNDERDKLKRIQNRTKERKEVTGRERERGRERDTDRHELSV